MSLIDYKNIEAKKISFDKLIVKKDQLQPYAFPLYDNEKFFKFLFPTAQLSDIRDGIATQNPLYPDADIHFIRYPLHEDNEETQVLRAKFEAVDDHLGSEEFRKQMFGKEYKKYKNYQSIVKFADNTRVDTNKYSPHPDYIKIQIKKNYDTKAIKSVVFVEENGERHKADNIETLDDMRKYIHRGGKITPQVDIIKLWVVPSKGEYGVKLGLVKTIAHPSDSKYSSPMDDNDDDFPDAPKQPKQEIDEESDEQEVKPVAKQEVKPVAKQEVAEVDSDDSDTDNSESESDSDSEPAPPSKTPQKTPAKAPAKSTGRGKK